MNKYRHCPSARQCLLILVFLFTGIWARASASLCQSQFVNQTYRGEVQRQWGYLDVLKVEKDKAIKRKSRRLLREIQNHAYANGVLLEADPNNSAALLVKILSKEELKYAHPFNRFATRLFELQEVRIEINPLKLKLDDAGALFDENTNRLTLAIDNILDLKTDSFAAHELRHAYSAHLEKLGVEHVFMGWIKRKPGTPILQQTYPDLFSFDELPAYYYQVLVLLREAQKNPESLSTAKQFLNYGLELLEHVASAEVTQFAQNQKMVIQTEEKTQTVTIETSRYILDFNFLKENVRTEQELKDLTVLRLQELSLRAKVMQAQLEKAKVMLERPDSLKQAIELLGSKRDVIDPKKVYNSGS